LCADEVLARKHTAKVPLLRWGRDTASWEVAMAVSSSADETESRRRTAASDKGVVDLAGDALKEIATLLHAELQLLRADISEKLTFTALSAALIGAGALLF